ncbi:hypothetical protein FITA111629_04425 [Filibacter tadaridae]|uniref:Uncharacterized protein n=1 Tax=Filibacter tadaridae TaxID=2483811 RepID=A0A3P5XNT7_9BACL|nr:hypothetical protein FILTAD_02746 [Filibacter tadaridae]
MLHPFYLDSSLKYGSFIKAKNSNQIVFARILIEKEDEESG